MAGRGDGIACDKCGSQDFHDEDGLPFCENGHQQEGRARIDEDEADYGTQGKLVRKRTERQKVKVLKVFHGRRAYRLFLQSYQYLLWKQCHFLVHGKHLPSELWTVVRDLWTLRLSKLLSRLEEAAGVSDGAEETSSGNEPSTETEWEDANESKVARKATQSPTLIESLALCYLGMLLLRLPVSLATLYRWVRDEDIVYLRAIRHIPAEMRDKLPGEYHEALDTQIILRRDTLQQAVFSLVKLYNHTFGLAIPPINSTLLLFDHMKALGLPIEVFKAVQGLAQIVDFDFKHDMSTKRRRTISLPDAQLISLIIIAVKLIYPFDSSTTVRHPRTPNEPAAQKLDWQVWLDSRNHFHGCTKDDSTLRKDEIVEVKDTDILNMNDDQLDAYMDWYQQTWAKTDIAQGPNDTLKREILDMFPLKRLVESSEPTEEVERERQEAIDQRLRHVQAHLQLCTPITDEEAAESGRETGQKILRPGSHYPVFRKVSDLSGHPVAMAFHEAAAEVACLEVNTLLRAVVQTERRITVWRSAKKRAERFGETIDVDAEMGRSGKRDKGKQRARVSSTDEEEEGEVGEVDESEEESRDGMEIID